MGRKTFKDKLCEKHAVKGHYGSLVCCACLRANMNFHSNMKLKRLFPVIMGAAK